MRALLKYSIFLSLIFNLFLSGVALADAVENPIPFLSSPAASSQKAEESSGDISAKKFSFLSADWLKHEIEDVDVLVTVNRMSPRLIAVSYHLGKPLDDGEIYNETVAGFMYCVNRYLVVESGYTYAALGTEKKIAEKSRVNFFIALLNKGEVPIKAGTYAGIPWFDKVLRDEFSWKDFVFLNDVSETTCTRLMSPDYSFRLIDGAV